MTASDSTAIGAAVRNSRSSAGGPSRSQPPSRRRAMRPARERLRSATEASKHFADLLDAVEHRGETFTVVRRGRVVATIAPARRGTGADLRRILAENPPDDRWADDLRDLRQSVGEAAVSDAWND